MCRCVSYWSKMELSLSLTASVLDSCKVLLVGLQHWIPAFQVLQYARASLPPVHLRRGLRTCQIMHTLVLRQSHGNNYEARRLCRVSHRISDSTANIFKTRSHINSKVAPAERAQKKKEKNAPGTPKPSPPTCLYGFSDVITEVVGKIQYSTQCLQFSDGF